MALFHNRSAKFPKTQQQVFACQYQPGMSPVPSMRLAQGRPKAHVCVMIECFQDDLPRIL